MKKRILNSSIKLTWMVLLAMFAFASCNKEDDNDDDDNGTTVLVEDGFYLTGAGTALTDLVSSGQLKVTRNEVTQEDRAQLLEIFVAVKGGTDGFNIVNVAGETTTTYGPGTGYSKVAEADLDGEEPTLGLWKGGYAASETAFTVEEDGIYHVIIDTELEKIAIAKVVWGVIGAATPGGWGGSTQFTEGTFDLNTMAFEITGLDLTKADWKFRYSNGWKIIFDAEYDNGTSTAGLKVNTNYGGAIDALVAGGGNIANDVPGVYTMTMTWTLGSTWAATAEKTGDLALTDYSETELGLIGNALVAGDGWTTTQFLSLPEQANTKYTWTWSEVELLADSSFKIREGQTWDNFSAGYPQVTMAGTSVDNFTTNDDGNFVVVADGTFDFTFEIEAATETFTLTVEPGGTPVPDHYWGVIGSAVPPYDWSEDVDMTWDYETNIWSITLDMVGPVEGDDGSGQWKFRADDDWTLAYGVDDNGDLSDVGGATNMAITEDGNYTIELILTDAENPTYTIVKN